MTGCPDVPNIILSILVTQQQYKTSAHEEYIITGNDALMKCSIPSFMSDFVFVTSWVDSEGNEMHSGSSAGNAHD